MFKTFSLMELCTLITDGAHHSPKFFEGGVPMYSVKDMTDEGFNSLNVKTISIEDYSKLKNAGCLLQLNLLSLTENYGKEVQKTSHRLLKENMYDFVGSDAHNLNHLRGLQKISTKKNKILVDGLMLRNNAIFNN